MPHRDAIESADGTRYASSSQAGSIERGLSLVPQEAHDADDRVAQARLVDLAAASAVTGIDQPGACASDDELSSWFAGLAVAQDPAETEVTIGLPSEFERVLGVEPSLFEDEWGIDLGQAESFAHVTALTEPFTMFRGGLAHNPMRSRTSSGSISER